MTFLAGPDHVVHAKACRRISENAVQYITKAKTHEELRALCARPDVKDRHEGPGLLVPCPECIE